jgi:hypothetical protein
MVIIPPLCTNDILANRRSILLFFSDNIGVTGRLVANILILAI